jgi:hypothetical protein
MVVPLYSEHLGNHLIPWIGLWTEVIGLNVDIADLNVMQEMIFAVIFDYCHHNPPRLMLLPWTVLSFR